MMSELPKGFGKLRENNDKLSDAEIVRLGLIAELDAINFYEQLATLAKDDIVKKALMDIAYEEKEHVGEFLELLKQLDPEQIKAIEKGMKEIKEMQE